MFSNILKILVLSAAFIYAPGLAAASASAVLGINIAGGPGEPGPVDGVTVFGVSPGGPADEAGLRSGDVITSIGGQPLAAGSGAVARERLLEFMGGVSPGDPVPLAWLRDGRAQTGTVVVGSAEQAIFPPGFPFADSLEQLGEDLDARVVQPLVRYWRYGGWLAGLELVALTPELGSYFGVDEGILVIRAPGTPGLGLRDGDVILKIGARVPRDPGHALRILRSYEPGEPLQLTLRRRQRQQVIELRRPETEPVQGRRPGRPRPAA